MITVSTGSRLKAREITTHFDTCSLASFTDEEGLPEAAARGHKQSASVDDCLHIHRTEASEVPAAPT